MNSILARFSIVWHQLGPVVRLRACLAEPGHSGSAGKPAEWQPRRMHAASWNVILERLPATQRAALGEQQAVIHCLTASAGETGWIDCECRAALDSALVEEVARLWEPLVQLTPRCWVGDAVRKGLWREFSPEMAEETTLRVLAGDLSGFLVPYGLRAIGRMESAAVREWYRAVAPVAEWMRAKSGGGGLAEEAFTEFCNRLLNTPFFFQVRAAGGGWAFVWRTAQNVLVDQWRAAGRIPPSLPLDLVLDPPADDSQWNPERVLRILEVNATLREVGMEVYESQEPWLKETLRLRLEGLKWEEVTGELIAMGLVERGTATDALKKRHGRALQQFMKEVRRRMKERDKGGRTPPSSGSTGTSTPGGVVTWEDVVDQLTNALCEDAPERLSPEANQVAENVARRLEEQLGFSPLAEDGALVVEQVCAGMKSLAERTAALLEALALLPAFWAPVETRAVGQERMDGMEIRADDRPATVESVSPNCRKIGVSPGARVCFRITPPRPSWLVVVELAPDGDWPVWPGPGGDPLVRPAGISIDVEVQSDTRFAFCLVEAGSGQSAPPWVVVREGSTEQEERCTVKRWLSHLDLMTSAIIVEVTCHS